MIKIKHISDVPHFVDTIAKWMCDEWGRNDNIDFFKSIVGNSLDRDHLPHTLVAMDGDTPIGTVGLWRCDMVSRQDLFPWLSALYVIEEYRGKGIGKELQNHLENYAKKLGYERLYLYTDIEEYYEKNDWLLVDRGITYSGEYDNIFMKEL